MNGYDNKTQIINKIEKRLSEGVKYIVYDGNRINLITLLCEKMKYSNRKDVVILCCEKDVWKCDVVNCISRQEMDEVLEVYYTYDFTDRILVISDSEQYGGILNYVKSGILTEEEMVEALLCKI